MSQHPAQSNHSAHTAHTEHTAHVDHGGHSGLHTASANAAEEYTQAFSDARPAPGCSVVTVTLEAQEVDWEFVSGILTRAWAFNQQIPGPTIEANVGDVLEVRLTNRLPEATTLHWHGLRLPAPMDGTDIVQRPVAPGETFTYRFLLTDAGTFWYHPHHNETVQMERGLYGALIVREADEPTVDRERVLVLDDIILDRDGSIVPPGDWVERRDGREGRTRLVGGRAEPELIMRAGQVERWRLVNASSARYVRLSIGGSPFRILGTGGGFLEAPIPVTETLLVPGDRVDIAVGPFDDGTSHSVESLAYDRGLGVRPAECFASVRVGPHAASRAAIPDHFRTIEPLVAGLVVASRDVVFTERASSSPDVDFLINDTVHYQAAPVVVGELQVWDVINRSSMDHPFHLHGFFFQVLERNGSPPAFRSWEDTENVPAGGRIRIAWLPDDRPGRWMYHCHILEHHEAGMMAHFDVVRSVATAGMITPDGQSGAHH